MKIQTIRTHKITIQDHDLCAILDQYISSWTEGSILAVTSKIVSICQGRVVKIEEANKRTLIEQEAEYYLPPEASKYHITLTIKNNLLIPTAGIDESNGNGYYILWPSNPQQTANQIRAYLRQRFACSHVGVIITDSKTTPLRWGVTGVAIAHSGFRALNNYVGTPDIFGRMLRITKVNVMDALAAAAVLVMGEGNEQTPLAIIEDLPFVAFQDHDPSIEELHQLRIAHEDDLYAPLLQAVTWHKGKQ